MCNRFATADILSIHVPLLESTHHLINMNSLAKLKDGVFIINTARGPIVETKALVEGIKTGKIAGAALDVVEEEPISLGHELLSFDNVYITPHSAFYSEEAVKELRSKAAKNIVDKLAGTVPAYVIV